MSAHLLERETFAPHLQPRFAAMEATQLATHLRRRKQPQLTVELEPEQSAQAWLTAMLAGDFRFNGETHRLARPIHWLKNPSDDLEWHILLHKFYHAPALGAAFSQTGDMRYLDAWQTQTLGWIEQVPPGFIAADVTGRRIQNWLYALHTFLTSARADRINPVFLLVLIHSIEQQVTWLKAHLHPRRNHRTLELFAILLAGVVLPELEQAGAWRRFAIAELDRNAASDFFDDGVHCELSSHYHCLVFKNFIRALEIARANAIDVPASLPAALSRARDAAIALTKPDGWIPALGDGDIGDYRALIARANHLLDAPSPPAALTSFDVAGYHILRSSAHSGDARDDFYLVFDCGPLGEGNHGHLDCLSFEAAAFGRSLVVDPGRYTYHEAGEINWRARFRGTAAHNTVQIDGREQTRYLPGQQRYKISGAAPATRLLARRSTEQYAYVHGEARSDEYPVVHDRRVFAVHGRCWLIVDTLTAEQTHRCDLRFQLSFEAEGLVDLDTTPSGARRIASPNLDILLIGPDDAELSIEDSFVSPRYGIKLPAPRVLLSAHGAQLRLVSLLVPWRSQAPDVELVAADDGILVTIRKHGVRQRLRFAGDRMTLEAGS